MKKFILILACFLLVLVATTRIDANVGGAPDISTIEVFINDKLVNTSRDSLEITAKGALRLKGIEKSPFESISFRIQIRRATSAGWQFMPFVEEYQQGKHFSTLNLEELLSNVKPGDQIVLIPIEDSPKYENSNKPIVLHVIGDRC